MGWIESLIEGLLQSRATIPAADQALVAADTALYTPDGQPLSVEQLMAADRAILDYVAHRIQKQVTPRPKAPAAPVP